MEGTPNLENPAEIQKVIERTKAEIDEICTELEGKNKEQEVLLASLKKATTELARLISVLEGFLPSA